MFERDATELEVSDPVLRMGLVQAKTNKIAKNARRCGQCRSPLANLNKSAYCQRCQEDAQFSIWRKESETPVSASKAYRRKSLRKRMNKEVKKLLDSRNKQSRSRRR